MHIWMLTSKPAPDARNYFDRAWCNMEFRLGALMKEPAFMLDLGKVGDISTIDASKRTQGHSMHARALNSRS